MSETTDDRRHLRSLVEAYLQSKGKGPDSASGNYRRNANRVITRFIDHVEGSDLDEPYFETLTPQTLRRWVRTDLLDSNLSARTVETYYNYVSAYLGWCVREGVLHQNPARTHEAEEELPTTEETRVSQQQSWTSAQRQALTTHLDKAVHDALEDAQDGREPGELTSEGPTGMAALKELRDRALGYVLAYSGVRGAEVLADPNDDRRNGAEWQDLDLEQHVLWVLSKKQQRDDRRLTPKPLHPLRQLEAALDPAPNWPLFPTLHWGRLYDGLRTHLHEVEDWTDDRIEAFVDDLDGRADVFRAYREIGARPPALRTDGARDLLRSLTEAADVELHDDHDYLEPHGGRRGAGAVLYQERSAEMAADQLDNSVGVVERFYSELDATEQSEDVGEAFDQHDDL